VQRCRSSIGRTTTPYVRMRCHHVQVFEVLIAECRQTKPERTSASPR
jgi:hypothetical protein